MASAPADTPQMPDGPRPRMRPRELEDSLNHYLYHPLAARLALLLRPTGVTPNAVSVVGALMVWGAAWGYTQLSWPTNGAVGLVFHMLWHVVDGADGDLARLTGKSSPLGEMVDGVCDYAGHAILYIALAAVLDDTLGVWAWLLGLAAAASHSVQSNHAETQRRSYLWRAYGVPWLKHAKAADDEVFKGQNWFTRFSAWLARRYLAVGAGLAPHARRIDAAVERATGDPERLDRMREIVRQVWRPSLALEKALGANPRTIILGLCMALGSPFYFFATQIVLMNLLLLISVWQHNRAGLRLAALLEAIDPA